MSHVIHYHLLRLLAPAILLLVPPPVKAQPVAEENALIHTSRDLLGIRALRTEYTYARNGDAPLKLDVYHPRLPAPAGGYPVIIWFHGGAWLMGSKRDGLHVEPLLAHGFAVVSVKYRLSTTAEFPAQIRDARNAASWVLRHAKSLHLNRDQIFLAGHSAGAHLALLTAYTEALTFPNWGDPLPKGIVKGVIAMAPPADLLDLVPPSARGNSAHPVALLLGAEVGHRLPLAKLASPISHVNSSAPPTLLYHGDGDTIVPLEQSYGLARKLSNHNVPVKLVVVPEDHHFEFNQSRLTHAELYLKARPGVAGLWQKKPWWQPGTDPPAKTAISGRPLIGE